MKGKRGSEQANERARVQVTNGSAIFARCAVRGRAMGHGVGWAADGGAGMEIATVRGEKMERRRD